jgi:hypothetical protein
MARDTTANKALYRRLRLNYFTHSEALKLSYPKTNQYSDDPQDVTVEGYKDLIAKAIRARHITRNNCIAMGMNDEQIAKSISYFYSSGDNSVFEFIRSEYNVKSKGVVDYHEAVTQRSVHSRAKIRGWAKSVFGIPYKSHRAKSYYEGKNPVANAVNKENRLI